MDSPKKFETAVLGGTFDHFHKGHKKLIERGLSVSERLVIGITSDEFVKKFKIKNLKLKIAIQNPELFESFIIRKKNVEDYLNQDAKDRYEIVKIDDMFGTTLNKNFPADAIVVSKETLKGAKIINTKRREKNLLPFEIIIQNPVAAQDGKPISSFRIRKGEIDREGRLYINPGWTRSDLVITDRIRKELKKPLGKLSKKVQTEELKNSEGLLISVGDESSRILNSLSVPVQISVIDFKIAREKRFNNIKELGFLGNEEVIRVKNPAGTISKELFETIITLFKSNLKGRRIVLIDGEDDLSVLSIVLASPLGSHVFYGQRAEGIVEVEVNEKNKAKIYKIVSRFITRGY